jgi:hypothetical protein
LFLLTVSYDPGGTGFGCIYKASAFRTCKSDSMWRPSLLTAKSALQAGWSGFYFVRLPRSEQARRPFLRLVQIGGVGGVRRRPFRLLVFAFHVLLLWVQFIPLLLRDEESMIVVISRPNTFQTFRRAAHTSFIRAALSRATRLPTAVEIQTPRCAGLLHKGTSCCLLFTVSGMDAGDRVRAMLLCPSSFLLRLAQSLRLSHCTTPYNRSEKNNHSLGFSGLLQLFSRLFCSG